MRTVVWTDPAENDLSAIDHYWQTHNPTRADEILDRLEVGGNFLATMPHAGPVIDRLTARKWRVASTNYVLIYRVQPDRIEVIRVFHAAQDWHLEP